MSNSQIGPEFVFWEGSLRLERCESLQVNRGVDLLQEANGSNPVNQKEEKDQSEDANGLNLKTQPSGGMKRFDDCLYPCFQSWFSDLCFQVGANFR